MNHSNQLPRFALAVLATGVIAGLVGLVCIHLLHWIQAAAWDMHAGTLLEAASAASPLRRITVLTIAGIVGGVSWFFLFRNNPSITSVTQGVAGAPMPPLRSLWHAFTQVIIVGLGASIGREVAPREIASSLSAWMSDRVGLSPEDRRIIVACGAGAGLSAVYSIPLSGAVYTLEILLLSFSARAVIPALLSSGIAVLISTGCTRPTPFYTVPTLTPSLSLLVFAALICPLIGWCGWAFREAVARVGAARPRDWHLLWSLPLTFFLVGVVSVWVPSVVGNGQASTQTQFDATWAGGVGLGVVALVLAAKLATTFATIRAGGWGGVLTPAVAVGAGVGAFFGLLWMQVWPGSELAAFVFLGAACFLGTSMKAPFTSLVLLVEFTNQGSTILVPAVIAVGGATAAAAWAQKRSGNAPQIFAKA